MNTIKQKIIDIFENKKKEVFRLGDFYDENEESIKKKLFEILEWNDLNHKDKRKYCGLFGWESFKPDLHINIDNCLLIVEVKKVTQKTEYGYWHALIQGMIYSFSEKRLGNKKFIVLCILLDWGRRSGFVFEKNEKNFIDQFRCHQIYFLRVSMVNRKFIEHNLKDEWHYIN